MHRHPPTLRKSTRPRWRQRLFIVTMYQGPVMVALGLALLCPLAVALWEAQGIPARREVVSYLLPALIGILFGGLLMRQHPTFKTTLSTNEALLTTTAAWITTSILGALPFLFLIGVPPVDALLESVSGFTTAGTTMLVGLDSLPRSIIVWRMLVQWLGGLGILLIVLLVGRAQGNSAYLLLSAEGVKVSSGRLSLNFRQAALRFVQIYLLLTVAQTLLTWLLGMPLFDSLAHAMTTVSTGGFSPHDESIAFYRNRPDLFPNYVWIELTIVVFMIAGGVNFYILYRLGRRQLSALWDNLEMRLLWIVLVGMTTLVAINAWLTLGGAFVDWLVRALFEIASLISTTGFETTATGSFPRLSRELFLLLMVVGGCAGSTAGGIKLVRLGLIGKFLTFEIRQLRSTPHTVQVPTVDSRPVSDSAFRQAVFILLLWLIYLVVGGVAITYLVPEISISDAFSTVFTAIGVFGPSFLSVDQVIAFPVVAKLIFIVGMLAGRLEILPLLVFFNPNAWRK
jgi:trk system potassium uptake protein TrkH